MLKYEYEKKILNKRKVNFMQLHEKLVSASEAAKILQLTTARIGVLCRQGRFQGAEKIGAGWVIPREAVLNHKRLPPGMKPRTSKREDDEKLISEFIGK